MLSLEGVEALGGDAVLAHAYWGLGVRMAGLTWNHRNAFADGLGVDDDRGLTREGGELVDLLAELGVMLDLSHASPRTFVDVLARAPEAVVLVSHAGCRAVCETPRNLSDDQLRAIAERGGVIGMMALPLTVDPERPTIERFVDHVDHAVDVAGIEHVGLGGDFIRQVARATGLDEIRGGLFPPGMEPDAAVEGLEGPAGYPALVAALERRGYTDGRLDAILSGNWLRLFRTGLPA
jgi:membrane dipeptidase